MIFILIVSAISIQAGILTQTLLDVGKSEVSSKDPKLGKLIEITSLTLSLAEGNYPMTFLSLLSMKDKKNAQTYSTFSRLFNAWEMDKEVAKKTTEKDKTSGGAILDITGNQQREPLEETNKLCEADIWIETEDTGQILQGVDIFPDLYKENELDLTKVSEKNQKDINTLLQTLENEPTSLLKIAKNEIIIIKMEGKDCPVIKSAINIKAITTKEDRSGNLIEIKLMPTIDPRVNIRALAPKITIKLFNEGETIEEYTYENIVREESYLKLRIKTREENNRIEITKIELIEAYIKSNKDKSEYSFPGIDKPFTLKKNEWLKYKNGEIIETSKTFSINQNGIIIPITLLSREAVKIVGSEVTGKFSYVSNNNLFEAFGTIEFLNENDFIVRIGTNLLQNKAVVATTSSELGSGWSQAKFELQEDGTYKVKYGIDPNFAAVHITEKIAEIKKNGATKQKYCLIGSQNSNSFLSTAAIKDVTGNQQKEQEKTEDCLVEVDKLSGPDSTFPCWWWCREYEWDKENEESNWRDCIKNCGEASSKCIKQGLKDPETKEFKECVARILVNLNGGDNLYRINNKIRAYAPRKKYISSPRPLSKQKEPQKFCCSLTGKKDVTINCNTEKGEKQCNDKSSSRDQWKCLPEYRCKSQI